MPDELITDPTVLFTKNTKRTGEFSEAGFLHRAEGYGFKLAKPWGDSERYDFILDSGSHLWKVQVKGTEVLRARGYEVRASYTEGKGRANYTAADIDVLAAHIIPLDLWYIVPVGVWGTHPMLRFYPNGAKHMRYEQYREYWDLFRQPPDLPQVICPRGIDPIRCPVARRFPIHEELVTDN